MTIRFTETVGSGSAETLVSGTGRIVLGLGGADQILSATTGYYQFMSGGSGGDTYTMRGSTESYVLDAGGSGFDSVSFAGSRASTYYATIDSRHLVLFDSVTGQVVTLLEWQTPAHSIEQIHFQGDNSTSSPIAIVNGGYDDKFIDNFSWSGITGGGWTSTEVNEALAYYAARSLALEAAGNSSGTIPTPPSSRGAYAPASSATPTDTLFTQQWYLQAGMAGVNVLPAWADYTGKGVKIGIFDQGIDYTHPDLDGNYIATGSINTVTNAAGGYPLTGDDSHGTAVAGVIAAERNGSGIVGVAYNASLYAYYNPLAATPEEFAPQVVRAFTAALQVDVINDSWGFGNFFRTTANAAFIDDFGVAPFNTAGQALARLAAEGRGGLGTIVVQSAGNTDEYGDDTNLHSFQNSRHTVVVAATGSSGTVTSYSVSGSSLLIAAPGGSGSSSSTAILTSDRVGAAGYSTTDYTSIAGTSFSAPIVSGIVALMLEANPGLGWRDVQEILSLSGRQAGSAGSWHYTGADDWNGGGRHYSEEYGFGLIDATAAVRLAETWTGGNTSADERSVAAAVAISTAVPANNTTGISQTAVLTSLDVEWVSVNLNLTHSWIGDLRITLTSPDGTVATLLDSPGAGLLTNWGSSQSDIRFTFSAATFRGEDAAGTWRLTVIDDASRGTGTLNSWTITAYGETTSVNDVYVYTDEFSGLTDSAGRATLTDNDGGSDTINAATVTTASRIALDGSASLVDGRSLSIASAIENAYGGDGNDTLVGSAAGNYLSGGRGNDLLQGGEGNDTLAGGPGSDTMDGGDGFDTLSFVGAASAVTLDAGDQVLNVEVIWGSSHADALTGSGSDDQLSSGFGNDTVQAGSGNDYVAGESGDDSLAGGDGYDWLWAGDGNDSLDGGAEKDNLNGESGNDVIQGGAGNDRITGRDGNDVIHAGIDNDWVGVWNDWGEDPALNYFPEAGDDEIHGDAGDDVLSAGLGRDTVDGGTGNDYVAGEHDDDLLFGGEGFDWLWAGSGNDWLDGGAEKDNLNGESGDDHIEGGTGNDRITGNTGNDTINAGDGNDWVGVWNDWGEDPARNYFPEAGDDLIFGDAGNDVLSAGFGRDTVHGGAGDDYVAGEQDDDELYGSDGTDWLWAGAGNDTLYGEGGNDMLIGESGADHFVFRNMVDVLGGGDRILDFNGGEGDRIDVHWFLSTANYSGSNPFGENRLRLAEADGDVTLRYDAFLIATLEDRSLAQVQTSFFII